MTEKDGKKTREKEGEKRKRKRKERGDLLRQDLEVVQVRADDGLRGAAELAHQVQRRPGRKVAADLDLLRNARQDEMRRRTRRDETR